MESDPTEELWDLGRNKTITAEVKQRTRSPFMCSDLGKLECIVSCTETTAQSSSGPVLLSILGAGMIHKYSRHPHTMGAATFY